MEKIKCQRTKQLAIETDSFINNTITKVEDLANELIYEIFEYLDSYHIYQSFFYLNSRFHSFLNPSKINLFLMSQKSFEHYNHDVIIPNTQRIHTLRIANCFTFDESVFFLSHKTFLRTLILENIGLQQLDNVVPQLKSLPYLTSLSITIFDRVDNIEQLYRQIFSLPLLKYCKLSLPRYFRGRLPLTINEFSPIEYLIIDYEVCFEEVDALLSYVPQLRHLSLQSLYESDSDSILLCSSVLKYLTSVSLNLHGLPSLDKLEYCLRNYFRFVEVLHIIGDQKYMNADQWKRFISSYLPNLHIFHVVFKTISYNDTMIFANKHEFTLFACPFLDVRQLCFEYKLEHVQGYWNPSRKNIHEQCKESNEISVLKNRRIFESVSHVQIPNQRTIDTCMCYFPHATKITLKDRFSTSNEGSIADRLSCIASLKQIRTLVITLEFFPFMKLIELLSFAPNIHTLSFKYLRFYNDDKRSIEENEIFRSVSNTNCITNITLKDACKLETLTMLFPRLQRMEIYLEIMADMGSVLRFLLNENNANTQHLISLYFLSRSNHYLDNFQRLISAEAISREWKGKLVDKQLCLWK